VNILITPYVLDSIGLERFGIWATVTILTGYLGLFDFGVGSAFLKHIAEYHARGEPGHVNDVINTGILFYGAFSLAVVLPVYFLRYPILHFFRIPPAMMSEAVFALIAGTAIFVIMSFFGIFFSVINGLQRMDVTNILGVIMSLVRALGIVAALELGYGLRGIMVNQILVATISMCALIVLVRKYFPPFMFQLFRFNKEVFGRLFRYGYKVQISRISQMVNLQLDKLLIGHFITMGAVGFYDVAAKISNAVKLLPLMSLTSIIPASSELQTVGDRERIVRLFYRGSRYLLAAAIPIGVFTFFNAPLVMQTWLGTGYNQAAVILRILIVGYSFNAAAGMGLFIALGIGRADMEMKYGIMVTVLNLFFSILFIIKWGLYGAALGSTLALIVSIVFFMGIFHRYLQRTPWQYYRLFVKPFGLSAGLALLNFALLNLLGIKVDGRVPGLTLLLVESVLFFGSYVFLLFRVSYFDLCDEQMLSKRFGFLGFMFLRREAAGN
jgi:O-antigen/teichoic acid export membrane protein